MEVLHRGLKTISVLALLLVIVHAQYDLLDCPKPWVDHDNKCYKFMIVPTSYESAGQDCARDGAALISINSATEHDFFQQWLIAHDDGNQDWFTSGRRRESSDIDPKFFWEGDGTEVQGFQFWATPQDRFRSGDIIVYHTDTGSTRNWKLADQTVTLPYVCEISKEQIFRIIDTSRGYGYGASEVDPNQLLRGPHFIKEPEDFIYDKDSVKKYVEMECIATAQPQPTYKWYKEENQRQVEINTMTQDRYTVINGKMVIDKPTDTEDNGNYQCVASNPSGSILSNQVQLSFGYLLDFPKSIRDPVIVNEYAGVGIECNPPKHYPAVLYSWYKDSIENFIRPKLKPYTFISHNGKLYFSAVTEDDEGLYYCLVSSPRNNVLSNEGKVSMPIQLIVREAVASVREPQIASGFPNVFPSSPKQGDNVRMECFALGTNEVNNLEYVWSRDDGPMPERAATEDHGRVLKIPDVLMIHAGRYRCTVTRVNGQSSTGTVQLPVDSVPFFTIPLEDEHVDLNSELRWLCISNGKPKPTYSWYRNATRLLIEDLAPEDQERYTLQNNVLTINPVLEKDAGMYQCAASNLHGARYSTAQLRVLSFAPSFKKYPMQPTTYATRSGNVTIICQPEAAPKGTKQWKKDGRVLNVGSDPLARIQVLPNGNLHINQIRDADEGEYSCLATNDVGRAEGTSKLTILSSTTISHFPRNTVVQVNHTAFMPCQASYNPLLDLTYLWYHNDRQINFIRIKQLSNEFYIEHDKYYARGTGINRGGLRIDRATFEMAGRYTCVARTASDRIEKYADLKVIGPPGMPASIFGERTTATTIYIRWVEGPNNGQPITSYTIEGYSKHEKYWHEVKANIRGDDLRKRETLVKGLSPWSEYQFRIMAENGLGLGEPSSPSEWYTTAEMEPEMAPENVGGGGGKVGDLVIVWDPLPPSKQNGRNCRYIVSYQKAFIIDEEWTEVEVEGQDTGRYVQLVGQNNYYTQYDVKVRAINNVGAGPDSDPVRIHSAEDIPIGVATNVRSFFYNSTALRVTWIPVPNNRETMKGVLLGYRINYWKEVGEDETMSIYNIIPGQTDTGLVIGLEPHTYYYVNVQVFNSAGNGPKSQDYLEETLRAAPMNQPTEVHVKVVDHDSVSVDWRGVSTGIEEEPLQGYMVRVWRLGESIYFPTDYDSEKKTHYTINSLEQDVYYNLRIFGYSRGGQGLMSSPTVQFILGRSCRILETNPDARFVYTCAGCSWHISYILLVLGLLVQYVMKR